MEIRPVIIVCPRSDNMVLSLKCKNCPYYYGITVSGVCCDYERTKEEEK